MRPVLVTGAAGVVGSHVVRQLRARDVPVVAADVVPAPGVLLAGVPQLEYRRLDIQDLAQVLDVLRDVQPELVVHLAALVGDWYNRHPLANHTVNVCGFLNMLEACRLSGVRRLVFASTWSLYPTFRGTPHGHPDYVPVPEDTCPLPVRPYEIAKYTCERMAAWFNHLYKLEFAALRFGGYYAAERRFQKEPRGAGPLTEMLVAAAVRRPFRLDAGGDQGFDAVHSELGAAVDLAIVPVVGPEVLSGSTRLKAGTATKLVLNTLTTGAMVRLGKCYGNLMVDLRATNSKLRARTNRIVRLLTGINAEEASTLLRQCDGELKTALVVQKAGVGPEEARERLRRVGGRVGAALEMASDPVKPANDLLLGIDGGGTHTVALLAAPDNTAPTGWKLLGRGTAGPSNRRSVGHERAMAALGEAVAAAFASAGLDQGPVAAACLGLAGSGRPEDQDAIRAWAEKARLAERVEVTSDGALLLAAGTPEGWGLALVAGTGSIAVGRTVDGRMARAGGWGYLLGDEGSGYALVAAAMRAVARASDGRGPATRLTERFLTRLGLQQPQGLVSAVYGGSWDRATLAALAPLVTTTAVEDAVAAAIVDEAARELAETAAAVVHQFGWGTVRVPLALAGGLLLADADYRQRVGNALERLGIAVGPVDLVAEPAAGAVRLALRETARS